MTKQSEQEKTARLMFCLNRGIPIPDARSAAPPADGPIPDHTDPAALRWVQEQIADLKTTTFTSWKRDASFEAGLSFVPSFQGTWSELSEMGKLAVLDFWVSWDGVNLRDRGTELLRHLDASKLPPEIAGQLKGGPQRAGGRRKSRDIEMDR